MRVALVVNEGVVGQLEEVQLVLVVPSVAHCTDDGRHTRDGGVVHVNVQRVVAVAQSEPLRHAATGNGNSGDAGVVHVERGLALIVRVHSVVAFEVVRSRGNPSASVPVVLALSEVHERSVHHDGLASKVVATVASEVAVFYQSVAEGSAAGRAEAACTALLLDVSR